MKRTRGRVVDIDTVEDLDARLGGGAGARDLRGWRLRRLDLRERSSELGRCRLAEATFLGCTFAPGDEDRVEAAGALVLPAITDSPVDPYRSRLYTADELYDDDTYARSLDGRAYAWAQAAHGTDDALAQTLHDHAIDEALEAWAADRRIVGVMGGHAAERGRPGYAEAARLGQGLGRSLAVATGGGPGAMEAANLGASLARHPLADLDLAVAELAAVPSFRPSVERWVASARAVRDRLPDPVASLGVPTWHYGHEPPNLFATAIAKYVRNATREAILLQICDAGIVVLPGAAGTVQEIFQDACENYYAEESSVAPMVLVGTTYWTETLPAWPLLTALARGRPMEPHVHLVDSVEEAVAVVTG